MSLIINKVKKKPVSLSFETSFPKKIVVDKNIRRTMTRILLKKHNPEKDKTDEKKKSFVLANRDKFRINEGAFVSNQRSNIKVRPKQSPIKVVHNASYSPKRPMSYSRTLISHNKIKMPKEPDMIDAHAKRILYQPSRHERTVSCLNPLTQENTFYKTSPRIIEYKSRPNTKSSSPRRPITSGNLQLTKTSFSQANLKRLMNDSNEHTPTASKDTTLESIIPNRIMNNVLRSKSVYMTTASFDNPMYHPVHGYPDLGIYKYQGIHSNIPSIDFRKLSIENARIKNSYSSRVPESIERIKTTEIDVKSNYLPTTYNTHYTNQGAAEDRALDSLMSSGDDNSAAVTPTVSKYESEIPYSSRPYMREKADNIRYEKNEEISLSYRDRSRSFGSNFLKGSKLTGKTRRSHVLISNLLNDQQQQPSYPHAYDVKPLKALPIKSIQLPL